VVNELIKQMIAGGASLIMHAGDYCAPFTLKLFEEANIPLLGVFGRNDGDHEGLSATAASGFTSEIYESPHSFDVGGHRILIVHDIGEIDKRSVDQHEFVIHGSTHTQEMKTRGDTLIINPGEACGWLFGSCTAALLDLDTKEVEIIKV
jgi:putative phosphoesterase